MPRPPVQENKVPPVPPVLRGLQVQVLPVPLVQREAVVQPVPLVPLASPDPPVQPEPQALLDPRVRQVQRERPGRPGQQVRPVLLELPAPRVPQEQTARFRVRLDLLALQDQLGLLLPFQGQPAPPAPRGRQVRMG